MAKTDVQSWDTNPSNNTDINGINIAENCPPDGINDAIRTVMGQIATWRAAPVFNGNMTISGSVSAASGSIAGALTAGTITAGTVTGTTVNANNANVVSNGAFLLVDHQTNEAAYSEVGRFRVNSSTGTNIAFGQLTPNVAVIEARSDGNVKGTLYLQPFGGDVRVNGAIRRTQNFYMDVLAGGPGINFDPTAYIYFDAATRRLIAVIDGIPKQLAP